MELYVDDISKCRWEHDRHRFICGMPRHSAFVGLRLPNWKRHRATRRWLGAHLHSWKKEPESTESTGGFVGDVNMDKTHVVSIIIMNVMINLIDDHIIHIKPWIIINEL